MAQFDKLKDDELPTGWERAGRHSTQGYQLTDFVAPKRVFKLAKELHAKSSMGATIPFSFMARRIMARLDNRFKSHLFAGRFGKAVSMPEAALIYIEMLEAGEPVASTKPVLLRKALEIGTIHEFVKWSLQFGEAVPDTIFLTVALIHNLRVGLPGISLNARSVSRVWLERHPDSRMSTIGRGPPYRELGPDGPTDRIL